MSLIRPLERADLPEVAGLYELVARSGRSVPAPGLAPYFERVLLDQPWSDPDIPSLVHLDSDGAIVAFQGSSVRNARYDGRPIKIACAGQLVAHPAARHRAVGALLLLPFAAWEYRSGLRLQYDFLTVSTLIFVVIFPSALAYLCFNRGIALIGPNRAAPFLHLMPVFGSAMAIVLLGEQPKLFHLIGYLLVFAGVIIASRQSSAK